MSYTLSSTTFTERPGLRRICPVWAYMDNIATLKDASRPVTVCDGDADGEYLVIVKSGLGGLQRTGYLVIGDIGGTIDGARAVCLGTYDGCPVWKAGSMFLFHSVLLNAWVWRSVLAEPLEYTITEEDVNGDLTTTRYGDDFSVLDAFQANADGYVACTAHGDAAEMLTVHASVFRCVGCGTAGEGLYTRFLLYGDSESEDGDDSESEDGDDSSGIQIGYGRWTFQGHEIVSGGDFETDGWFLDRVHVNWSGAIVYRDGTHNTLGLWKYAGVPVPGNDIVLAWEWAEGVTPEDHADLDTSSITFAWDGYASGYRKSLTNDLVYQASRLL